MLTRKILVVSVLLGAASGLLLTTPRALAKGAPTLTIGGPSGTLDAGQPEVFGCSTSSAFVKGTVVDFYVIVTGGGGTSATGSVTVNSGSTAQYTFSSLNAGTYEAYCSDGSGSSNTVHFTITALGYQGYVDPKYIVLGVTYAPPGPSASTFVNYQNSTFVGTTRSLSSSFESSNTKSVSITNGGGLPFVANGKITSTYASTASQTSKSTSTVTVSFQVNQGEKTGGTGSYFAPVDNDYDTIYVWLNPAAIFTVVDGNPVPVWNGYGVDTTDEAGMDIVAIQLGYLNGHFGAIPPDIQTSLNRAWAAKQVFGSGEGPALTSADLAQIASSDPFSVSTYGKSIIGYAPPAGTTSDDRFTLSACSSQSSFDYLQAAPSASAAVYTCTLTYTNLTTQAEDLSSSYQQTFSTDVSFSGTGFLVNFSADLKTSNTLTWTTDSQSSITASTTSTSSFSDQGPPCGNTTQGVGPCVPVYDSAGNQPTQFEVYQDNEFGTFMFAPVHYY